MVGIVGVNIRLDDAGRVVLQLPQGGNQNIGPRQSFRSGNLVGCLARLGQCLAIELALHGIPRQESGDEG